MGKSLSKVFIAATTTILVAANANAFSGSKGQYYFIASGGSGNQAVKQTVSGIAATSTRSGNKGSFGLMFQAGAGYYILDDLRAEVVVHYDKGARSKTKTTGAGGNINIKGQDQSIGGFANIHYDLISSTRIMPYVMAGLGYTKSELTSHITAEDGTADSFKKSRSKFVYAIGGGVGYHLGVNWDMDLGYRLFLTKKKKTPGTTGQVANLPNLGGTDTYNIGNVHAFLLGMRHSF